MSLVNASLRPSGKSYRNRLIAGEFNKNPSQQIDDLLKDNKGFLIFQEDTIKFLTDICGFSGSLADTTRRAIGKKDLVLLQEQLPKILEGYCNKSDKPREIAEKEAKQFIQIISDSSEYQFGYNHSTGYSMNGYMCARLRYYYPLEFTTAYLNNAENQEDIDNGVALAKYKNINIKNPQFRYSKGEYMCDSKTNTIYKGVGSIKYLNESCANQLYKLRDNQYNSFIELLYDISEKVDINSRQMEALIYLDYFSEFGKTKKLLDTYNLYQELNGKKQIKKEKINNELGLTEELVRKYSQKETEKIFKEIDIKELLNNLYDNMENKNVSLKEKITAEIDYLGYPITKLKTKGFYYVIKIDEFKNKKSITRYLTMYDLQTDDLVRYKLSDFRTFAENPIKEKQLIKILEESKKPKKYKDENGEWRTKQDEFNFCIDSWICY
jgi:DNA polymerase-3 subunit alpha